MARNEAWVRVERDHETMGDWTRAVGRLRPPMETMLFGVGPLAFATFAFVTTIVGITCRGRACGPAWGAVRIDPATALRN
jgi:hypothetical protein